MKNIKKIQLGHHQNKEYKNPLMFAIVDDEDYEELNAFKWCAQKRGNTCYAVRALRVDGKWTIVQMHAQIMQTPKGMHTDHRDGNGLNNQRANLRVCTTSQNAMNQGKRPHNQPGFKGISWDKGAKKWKAQIMVNSKQINLGRFPTKELAHEAYIEACKKYHGAFANY